MIAFFGELYCFVFVHQLSLFSFLFFVDITTFYFCEPHFYLPLLKVAYRETCLLSVFKVMFNF
jgi:hypothetical protein